MPMPTLRYGRHRRIFIFRVNCFDPFLSFFVQQPNPNVRSGNIGGAEVGVVSTESVTITEKIMGNYIYMGTFTVNAHSLSHRCQK